MDTGKKKYSVYEHVFPNGKRYIGISSDPEHRWQNGNGYKTQKKVWNAIRHYGWENIEHNIIVEGLTREQASLIEQKLIAAYDAIENGYNVTIGGDEMLSTYLEPHVLRMITKSKEYDQKRGIEQKDDDIVSIAEKAKYNEKLAKIINNADSLVQGKYCEYKRYSGQSYFHDLGEAKVDCYWWTLAKVLSGDTNALEKTSTPYLEEWIKTEGVATA